MSAAPAHFEWGELTRATGMRALALVLAHHAMVTGYDAAVPRLDLELPEPLRPLAEDGVLEQLRSHLVQYFGAGLQLEVNYGPAEGSLAAAARRQSIAASAAAIQTMSDSSFVADMGRHLGALVYVDSISPSLTPVRADA